MAGTRDAVDSMPPWDAAAYFQEIKETTFPNVGTPAIRIVKADSSRVALIFSALSGGTGAQVSTSPQVTTATGITLSSTGFPVQFVFNETGPLCQKEWWAVGGGFASVCVIEVLLTRWPTAADKKGRKNGKPSR